MIHYALPTLDELSDLGQARTDSVSIYLPTAPTPQGRELALTGAKSAVDEAIRTLREAGRSHAEQAALSEQWELLAADAELWGNLSNSLVIFLAPGYAEEYVVANRFEPSSQLGDYFDLSQLIRAVTTPQRAFALTLSANGWNLWQATAAERVRELELVGDHAEDAAEATNRMSIRGRQLLRRLGGDEGQKVLLERYAQVVAEAVRDELRRLDANGEVPLFVFANEPLLGMIQAQELPGQIVAVPGASDELRPDQLDEAIRERIGDLTAASVTRRADQIANGFVDGLAVIDAAQLARAAVAGAVDTMIYDLTADLRGTLDEATGAITLDGVEGHDLLSRIAVVVLRNGGEVLVVRPGEITTELWNGRLLAGLRHPLA